MLPVLKSLEICRFANRDCLNSKQLGAQLAISHGEEESLWEESVADIKYLFKWKPNNNQAKSNLLKLQQLQLKCLFLI